MNLFLLNILLAAGWCALTGGFEALNLVAGFTFGYFALWIAKPLHGEDARYFGKVGQITRLVGYFLYELLVSSVRVFWDVITPTMRARPGVVAVPLEAKTDAEITILANLISLTPGTLSLDVSHDRSLLYVHAMFVDDPQSIRDDIRDGMEKRVLEVMR